MALIEWKKEYETGVDRIDFQHRHLVNILNDLLAVPDLEPLQRQTVIASNLHELEQYIKFHFEVEESLMAGAHYKGLEDHKKTHEELRTQVKQHVKRFNEGEKGLETELISFLTNWLVQHIGKVDMAYAPFVLAHEQAG